MDVKAAGGEDGLSVVVVDGVELGADSPKARMLCARPVQSRTMATRARASLLEGEVGFGDVFGSEEDEELKGRTCMARPRSQIGSADRIVDGEVSRR